MKNKILLLILFLVYFLNMYSIENNKKLTLSINNDININLDSSDNQNSDLTPDLSKEKLDTNQVSGYSIDTGQQTSTLCYHATSIYKTDQTATVNFDSSTDIYSLARDFSTSLDINGGYQNFSGNAVSKYLHTINETTTSKTYNYYWKLSNSVYMNYTIDRDSLLTPVGERIYQNGRNPNFRLICGDTLIQSYEEGALLIVTITLYFKTNSDKKEFLVNVPNINYSDIASGGGTSTFSDKLTSSHASISITAKQIGGDTTKLNEILNTGTTLSTDVSKIACDTSNFSNCSTLLNSIKNYVSKTLPDQFLNTNKSIFTSALVPLGNITLANRVSPVLSLTPSTLTPTVLNQRKQLLAWINENTIMMNYLNSLINNYPVTIKDNLKNDLNSLLDTVNQNLALLQNNSNGYSPSTCWNSPDKCMTTYNYFKKNITPINYKTVSLFYFLVFSSSSLTVPDIGWGSTQNCTSIAGYFYPYGYAKTGEVLYQYSANNSSSLIDDSSTKNCHFNSGYAYYTIDPNNLKKLVPSSRPIGTFNTWSGDLLNDDYDQFIKPVAQLTFNAFGHQWKSNYQISYSYDGINLLTGIEYYGWKPTITIQMQTAQNPFNPYSYSNIFPKFPVLK